MKKKKAYLFASLIVAVIIVVLAAFFLLETQPSPECDIKSAVFVFDSELNECKKEMRSVCAFCLDCYASKEECEEAHGMGEGVFPSEIVVATQAGLTKLVFDSAKNSYATENGFFLPNVKSIVSFDGYVFAATESEVIKLNSKLEKVGSKKFEGVKDFPSIGSIATDNKHLFVGAEGSFIALNKELEELSRVDLNFGDFFKNFKGKNVHDILLYKDTAYLLDNIMYPVYLYRVDIKNPKELKIISDDSIEDIYAHLDGQWLNPEEEQWAVIQSYSHMGGSGQKVHLFPIKEDTGPSYKVIDNYTYSTAPEKKTKGFRIEAVTPLPPVWAVVEDAEDKYYLAQIKSDGNELFFEDFFELSDIAPNTEIVLGNKNNYVFVAPLHEFTLKLFDVKEIPAKMVLSQNLEELGIIAGIVDIAFLKGGSAPVSQQEFCSELEDKINELIKEANYCKEDSDCIISTEFWCPFGCYNLFNKDAGLTGIREEIKKYREKCQQCKYKCGLAPTAEDIKCKNSKCIDVRFEETTT